MITFTIKCYSALDFNAFSLTHPPDFYMFYKKAVCVEVRTQAIDTNSLIKTINFNAKNTENRREIPRFFLWLSSVALCGKTTRLFIMMGSELT